MNIRNELMYKYICYQEEKERSQLLKELEITDNRLDVEARLFLMKSIVTKFRKMQEDNPEKTNFHISFTTNGNQILDKGYTKDFKEFSYSPNDILGYAMSISSDYGIACSSYINDYFTEYNFSVNLLEEKKTKQGHIQTLIKRK